MKRWQHEATTAARTVQRWWTIDYPDCAIGIAAGPGSGLVVIDLDVAHGASTADGVREWEHFGYTFDTATVATKRGGLHLYFATSGAWKNSRSDLAPGIDVRSAGGFAVAPPTPGYRWLNDLDAAALPADVHALLDTVAPRTVAAPLAELPEGGHTTAYGRKVLRSACQRVKDAPEGQRRSQLFKTARYVGGWIADGEIRAKDARSELAYAAKVAGLDTDEAAATIEGGLTAGAALPLTKP
jgi:hypothetical protein